MPGILGLALAVTLVAAACGGGSGGGGGGGGDAQTGGVQKGGVYRTALSDFAFTGGFDPTGEYIATAFTYYNALLRTLVATKHIAGAEGNKLYPDLAAEMPTLSSDGLTYTFKLKPNIKFAPPVNRVITSKDIEYAFERINNVAMVAQYGTYYCGVIKGMDCKAKTTAPITDGIETPDDSTIIFHLVKQQGDFLYRLSMAATAPMPPEVVKCFTKAGDYGRYLISSGPYMIKGADQLDISSCAAMKPISGLDPTKKLLMVRNPNYDQGTDDLRTNNVEGIQISVDTNVSDIFNRVESGQLDGSLLDIPPRPILQRYLTDPEKKKLTHFDSGDRTWFITMNLSIAPFDDIHVRKAVNLIMDKGAILQAWGGSSFGQIATHIMPPTVLNGALDQSYDPYGSPGFHGDLAKAQAEMKQSRYDTDKDGLCNGPQCQDLVMINRNVAPWTDMEPVISNSLAKIGIKVKPRELAAGSAYTTIQTVKNEIPIAINAGWGKDYADAFTFAFVPFAGSGINPTGNVNYALVGITPSQAGTLGVKLPAEPIPSVDADIDTCEKIPLTQADTRTDCWVNLDKRLTEQVVPLVPYLWANNPTVLNASTTHYEFDQFSGYISLTEIAVNNKVTAASLS